MVYRGAQYWHNIVARDLHPKRGSTWHRLKKWTPFVRHIDTAIRRFLPATPPPFSQTILHTHPVTLTRIQDQSTNQSITSKMASATSFRSLVGVQPSTASTKDSTLIIIDAQNEYAEGKLAVSNAASSRKAIASLLQKYRDANGKIVHVTHVVPDGAPVFTPNTALAEEFEELTPRQGEKVVKKMYPSAFAETDLAEYLKGEGQGKVVLTGYMVSNLYGRSHGCD